MSGGGGGGSPNNTEWRFNQTLRNVQGFPGKVLLTQRSEPVSPSEYSSHFDRDEDEHNEGSQEGEGQSPGNSTDNTSAKKLNLPSTTSKNSLPDTQGVVFGVWATDSARIAKVTQELSRPAVILDTLCELSWSGMPPYMRPNIWRLLLDHYTFAQPGIQHLVFRLKELVHRIDEPLSKQIEEQGLEFLQFSFRWFNCLLIREVPFHLVTRLWDTYLAEGDYLPDFLMYIAASFLLTWSDKLQKLDFQEMVMFLQRLLTRT